MTPPPHLPLVTQRWRERRDSYRPVGETIDASLHAVDVIDRNTARAFVVEHHYSGSFPSNRLNVGLFCGRALVGVAVFSVPATQASIPARTGGLPPTAGVELGRFVLLDAVPSNAETWFLARAFRLVRSELPEVRAVVSYSDPHPRCTAEGRIVMPGHLGIIYRAFNGRFVGMTSKRTIHLGPDGRELPPRSLSKIRNGERGDGYAYDRLLALGAPKRRPYEDPRAYVTRALTEGPFRASKHPGCLAYVWAFDKRDRRGLPPALPYPRRDDLVA